MGSLVIDVTHQGKADLYDLRNNEKTFLCDKGEKVGQKFTKFK
jgi:hypothetical protein